MEQPCCKCWCLDGWLIVLFAWQDEQRSLVKLAQVIRDGSLSFVEVFAGYCSLHTAMLAIARRMRSGCEMNQRKKHLTRLSFFALESLLGC